MRGMAVDVNVLTYADALAAGFVSFASPCALALVPGYLSFVSGASYDELTGAATVAVRATSVVRTTGAFVAGFAAMFTLWHEWHLDTSVFSSWFLLSGRDSRRLLRRCVRAS